MIVVLTEPYYSEAGSKLQFTTILLFIISYSMWTDFYKLDLLFK